MPHLYTHIRHGDEYIQDLEGADYGNLEAARADVIVAAREIMSERLLRGISLEDSQYEIADESGEILTVLHFHEAISAR